VDEKSNRFNGKPLIHLKCPSLPGKERRLRRPPGEMGRV
jgi:hypothetical protein